MTSCGYKMPTALECMIALEIKKKHLLFLPSLQREYILCHFNERIYNDYLQYLLSENRKILSTKT